MIIMKPSYYVWTTVVDANPSWDVYYIDKGSNGYEILTGHRDVIFVSMAQNYNAITDATDFETSYKSGGLAQPNKDDAIALLVGVDTQPTRYSTDGRLVISNAISNPINTASVSEYYIGEVKDTKDSFYTIPAGESLHIQKFCSGSEATASSGNKAELYYAPNGNTSGIMRIGVPIYTNGSTYELGLDWSAPDVGDGTRSIMVRRYRFSGGSVEIAAAWEGYY